MPPRPLGPSPSPWPDGGPWGAPHLGLRELWPPVLPPRLLSPSLSGGLGRNVGRPAQQPHAPACPPHARRLLSPPSLGGPGRDSLFLGPGLPALPAELILLVDTGRATGQQPCLGIVPETTDHWAHVLGQARQGGRGPSCQAACLCPPSPPGSMTSAARLPTCCPAAPLCPTRISSASSRGCRPSGWTSSGWTSPGAPSRRRAGAPSPGSSASLVPPKTLQPQPGWPHPNSWPRGRGAHRHL